MPAPEHSRTHRTGGLPAGGRQTDRGPFCPGHAGACFSGCAGGPAGSDAGRGCPLPCLRQHPPPGQSPPAPHRSHRSAGEQSQAGRRPGRQRRTGGQCRRAGSADAGAGGPCPAAEGCRSAPARTVHFARGAGAPDREPAQDCAGRGERCSAHRTGRPEPAPDKKPRRLPPQKRAGSSAQSAGRAAHRSGSAGDGSPAGCCRRPGCGADIGSPAGCGADRAAPDDRNAQGRAERAAGPAQSPCRTGERPERPAAAQPEGAGRSPEACRPAGRAGCPLAVGKRTGLHGRRHPEQQAEDPAGGLHPDELPRPHPCPRQHPPDADDGGPVRAGAHRC